MATAARRHRHVVKLMLLSGLHGRDCQTGFASAALTRPTPPRIKLTDNYREATALSQKLTACAAATAQAGKKQKVAIIGGGLSGLSCAKYLSDAGHEPLVLEARGLLGGKVSAWQDEDGDWIETGLHIFFGAYPNMMNMFAELDIEDRLQWKDHKMTFAMQERPGEFTSFNFPPNVPAPFNMAAAILSNTEMLTIEEKLRMVPGLLPMLTEGQSFIDAQDELSVLQFMEKYGMPRRINDEIFIAMGKALDFIDPDKLSMTVVLTAMNRFINEADGSQTAFLDGNQPDRLCAPMKAHIEARGGEVRTNAPVAEILTREEDGSVQGLRMQDGSIVTADIYVSAMPVDVLKRLVPARWSTMPYFRQFDELEGIPVINVHIWFDRKLRSVDGLCFSRSPLLSVYADMSTTCKEYYDEEKSMLELVFAPCSPLAGGNINWIAKSDEEIIDATMGELARLFPLEIANDPRYPATSKQGPQGQAKLRKYAVVKVPRSVYAAIPGRNKYRPSQETPIPNLVLAGDWTSQKYLGSMEGAILGGKLAAEVVADKALGTARSTSRVKVVPRDIVERAAAVEARKPVGVRGNYPIAFGGGQQGVGANALHA
ncbi:phytoene desaturase [Chrysochromulina tobinii]|uniref:Amine oxidase n=1 Tax=Chrysochromulina tobinii TaxID=1460289 RepID=A0A0M0JCI3_9EUKA|nr:phytoene desaturase [Chrysochromulina tobinii]|eukprot:KOO24306.1 phytoene desaturase [Chrysochromulina sp. CCMP291]